MSSINIYKTLKVNDNIKNLFPRFFDDKVGFNKLNDTLGISDDKANILEKFLSKTYQKLILKNGRPIFFIRFIKSTYNNFIDSIIICLEREFTAEDIEYIKKHIFLKKSLLSTPKPFLYYVAETDLNINILNKLGFKTKESRITMELDLSKYHFSLNQKFAKENLEIVKVKSNRDINERVKTQNNIFDNAERVPLEAKDIVSQMNHPSYVNDLALLLEKDRKSIGYGQLVKDKEYWLVNFGIVKNQRGQGYSDYLLNQLLDRAYAFGVRRVLLDVYSSNNKAIGLYLKHGFKYTQKKSTMIFSMD